MYNRVIELFNKGKIEEARAMQFECVKMIRALGMFPPIPTQKEILRLIGSDLGGCRLPLTSLNENQKKYLKKYLEEISFFRKLDKLRSEKV